MIVDIVETGTTLRQNQLEVTREILPVSARFIANKASMKFKGGRIEEIARKLAAEIDRREEKA